MKLHDRRPDSGMRERWMVSYVDVLTILLIFFVAIAAESLRRPKSPVQAASPKPVHRALDEVQQMFVGQRLDLSRETRGLVISLPQVVLFRPGQDEVEAEALPVVDQIAGVLRRIPNKISLIGHADPVPIHNRRFRSNWELAAARGLRLLEVLTERSGIAESRLSIASYGSVDPKGSNDTADGRANNRRVEILILDAEP
jgi:chemotaxis protein MotB